ncbi:hypothetical protein V0288_08000 [Pannus brasiliensis CCIBt3594]|uniref:Uncharacterized protein n=1 Tax=Pannus brasiliensis CCIBt3594 TaxID=1427578 RepID=A0AAW9QU43_9CHRO
MTRKMLVLSTASSSLLSLLILTNAVQASPESSPVHLQGMNTSLEMAILNPANREENPIFRHIGCSCAVCTRSTAL